MRCRSPGDCSCRSPTLCQISPPLKGPASAFSAGSGSARAGSSRRSSSKRVGSEPSAVPRQRLIAPFPSGKKWGRASATAASRAGVNSSRSTSPPRDCSRWGRSAGASFHPLGRSQSSGSNWGLCSCWAKRLSQSARVKPARKTLCSRASSKASSGTEQDQFGSSCSGSAWDKRGETPAMSRPSSPHPGGVGLRRPPGRSGESGPRCWVDDRGRLRRPAWDPGFPRG